MENVTNNSHGRAATSFMHSSEDGSKNQPILKSELDEFLDDKRRALLITGGKANRKQRRKWAKGTKK